MGKVVDVTLRLIDNVTGNLNNVSMSLTRNANQWAKAGRQIQSAGKAISNVGMGLTKSVTVPIVSAGAACVKLAADFESGMSKVQSICGASTEEMQKLTDKAKEMGAKTKFSATQSAEAFSYMAMAGWKTEDMLNGIEGIMYLAGATGEDLATTSDIVTDALTAFGMSASETNRFVDILAKTSSNANTNVSLMGETFQYVAPVAGALGYNVEDVSVAIGLMANSGIKASVAGTSLRSLFTNLAKPTKSVTKAMDELGISMTDEQGNMKDFSSLMQEMRKSFGGMTEAQKAQYAATLAGKTGMSGLLAIVNASDSDFDALTESIANSSGAAEEMYEVANNNLTGQLTVLKSTVESIAISFGEKLTPYVKTATEWIQKLADKFNSLTDEQQNTIIKVALIAAAIGPAILVFGKMVTGVGKVVSVFGKMGQTVRRFGGIMKLVTSPAGIVIGVLAALAVGAFLIYKNWDKLKPVFTKVATQLKGAVEKIKPTIDSMITKFEEIKSKVGPPLEELFGTIQGVIGSVAQTISENMPVIQSIITQAFEAASPYIQMAGEFLSEVADVVGDVLKAAIEATGPVVEKLGECFNEVFPVVLEIVKLVIEKVSETLKKLEPVFKVVFSVASEWIKFIVETLKDLYTNAMTILGGVIDFITGVFSGNWEKAWNGIVSVFSGIMGGLETIVKAPLNGVISMINGVIKGINKLKIPGTDGVNIPLIPKLAKGTNSWKGGIVQISEAGGEIVDLPTGSRVYPHDKSVQKAYADGQSSASRNVTITIPKIADTVVIREEADINKIADKIVTGIERTAQNMGGGKLGYIS